jgi:phosphopantetheinyl transferase (holo-ACP synthase)
LRLFDRAAALAAEHGISKWHVSLTHTDKLAMAMVLAESGAPWTR